MFWGLHVLLVNNEHQKEMVQPAVYVKYKVTSRKLGQVSPTLSSPQSYTNLVLFFCYGWYLWWFLIDGMRYGRYRPSDIELFIGNITPTSIISLGSSLLTFWPEKKILSFRVRDKTQKQIKANLVNGNTTCYLNMFTSTKKKTGEGALLGIEFKIPCWSNTVPLSYIPQ